MLLAEPTSGVVWNATRGAISLRVPVFGKHTLVGLQHQCKNTFAANNEIQYRFGASA
jgi:hypothetical protein